MIRGFAAKLPRTWPGSSFVSGPAHFQPVADLCAAGDLDIHIDRTFTLDQVPEALAHVGQGHALGKVVVSVN
jgi:NADPH:quinone reductase-like Zn-dependent oxidoreductase